MLSLWIGDRGCYSPDSNCSQDCLEEPGKLIVSDLENIKQEWLREAMEVTGRDCKESHQDNTEGTR